MLESIVQQEEHHAQVRPKTPLWFTHINEGQGLKKREMLTSGFRWNNGLLRVLITAGLEKQDLAISAKYTLYCFKCKRTFAVVADLELYPLHEKTNTLLRMLPPKNSVLQLIHRVKFFQCLSQNHTLTFIISQSGLIDFPIHCSLWNQTYPFQVTKAIILSIPDRKQCLPKWNKRSTNNGY